MSERTRQARLFVGIKISLAAVKALASTAEPLRRKAADLGLGIRWVAPASYHITLKFLGWTRPEAIEAVRDVLAGSLAGMPGFEIGIQGLGAFPAVDHARVLWAGVEDGDGALVGLADVVEQELGELGFARERRPFHPHVTLGRLREPGDLSALLLSESDRMFRQVRVDAVVLYESIMKTKGSEYMTRARFPLGEPPPRAERQTGALRSALDAGPADPFGGPEALVDEYAKMPLPEADMPPPEAGDQRTGKGGEA